MFLAIKIILFFISVLLVWLALRNNSSKYLAFVVIAIWLRFCLSAFHQFTYEPVFADLSVNALIAVAIAACGLMLLSPTLFTQRRWLPLYGFLIVVILSGLINAAFDGLAFVMMKWLYFLTIASAIAMAIRETDTDTVLEKLLITFFLPVSLAVMSVVLGDAKATESDGSASFIGGYHHEAAFSMIIVCFMSVVALISAQSNRYRGLLFLLGAVLLLLVNYRTSILAVLPLVVVFAWTLIDSKVPAQHRSKALFASAVGGGAIVLLAGTVFQHRFADVSIFIASLDELFKAPEYYSEAEKDIFSARVYLWSLYLYAYTNGPVLQQLVGWGPESWVGVFPKYAHNTYVSYLYEYGITGLLTFLFAVGCYLRQAFRIGNRHFAWLLFSAMVGFLIMNFATMPLWNIEGLILFAILTGNAIGAAKKVSNGDLAASALTSRLAN